MNIAETQVSRSRLPPSLIHPSCSFWRSKFNSSRLAPRLTRAAGSGREAGYGLGSFRKKNVVGQFLSLLLWRLSKAHTRSATVLVDELDPQNAAKSVVAQRRAVKREDNDRQGDRRM